MTQYLLKRFWQTLPVIVGVVSLVFFLIHLVPGDPVDMMLGEGLQSVDHEKVRALLGLNHSLFEQYLAFWKHLLDGSWGFSFAQPKRSVLSLILEHFPATLWLAFSSLGVALVVSLPLGVLSAYKARSFLDKVSTGLSLLGMSIPIFVLAPLAVLLFSIRLRWLPVSGMGGFSHLVLPALCLGFGMSGLLTRMVRSSMLENLNEDFVRTARAKGLGEAAVLFRHTFKNALIPIFTILGNLLGSLLAGAVVTETLFDWSGIGNLFFKAFQSRDYPLVQGLTLWIALVYVGSSLLIDLLYAWIDPRIRLFEAEAL